MVALTRQTSRSDPKLDVPRAPAPGCAPAGLVPNVRCGRLGLRCGWLSCGWLRCGRRRRGWRRRRRRRICRGGGGRRLGRLGLRCRRLRHRRRRNGWLLRHTETAAPATTRPNGLCVSAVGRCTWGHGSSHRGGHRPCGCRGECADARTRGTCGSKDLKDERPKHSHKGARMHWQTRPHNLKLHNRHLLFAPPPFPLQPVAALRCTRCELSTHTHTLCWLFSAARTSCACAGLVEAHGCGTIYVIDCSASMTPRSDTPCNGCAAMPVLQCLQCDAQHCLTPWIPPRKRSNDAAFTPNRIAHLAHYGGEGGHYIRRHHTGVEGAGSAKRPSALGAPWPIRAPAGS